MFKQKPSFYISIISSLLCFLSTYQINDRGGEFLFYFLGVGSLACMLVFIFTDK